MKHPSQWTRADLQLHLQHALDVEFWTIPLYLTALYSIRGLRKLSPHDYPDAAKLILSVVIQEMLHLEIVCNLSHALGHTPHFHAPRYKDDKSIPFIHPKQDMLPQHLRDYTCQPGALGQQTLKLFCAIELPHAHSEIQWETQHSYHNIAEMYQALQLGISHLWDSCYVGEERNNKQKISFRDYEKRHHGHHGFSQVINSLESAMKAIEAIVEQGEGADKSKVPHDFQPPKLVEGKEFDPGWFRGDMSHYQKFSILLHHYKKLPEVYYVTHNNGSSPQQILLTAAYKDFLAELPLSFARENHEMGEAFWTKMYALANAITAVWESGSCPDFEV